jgi:tRNA(Ile)-lysidine synthase
MERSRKSPRIDLVQAAGRLVSAVEGARVDHIAAAVSGGVDSVVLLHVLRRLSSERGFALSAVHVHHGLSPRADEWARFVARLCRGLRVPLVTKRVKVVRRGKGLEAAAREARYEAFATLPADAIALAHHLDDQAETVLLRLLRGAGVRGAGGMQSVSERRRGEGPRWVLRPLLGVSREAIVAYARRNRLEWVEDESNVDDTLTRNFIRTRVGPVLRERFPRWREALARAASHFRDAERVLGAATRVAGQVSAAGLRAASPEVAKLMLREYLAARGLNAPSARRLNEMLRQIATAAPGAKVELRHDGATLRVYRGALSIVPAGPRARPATVRWRGERRIDLPEFGGELRFRRVRGKGIDPVRLDGRRVTVRARTGGERLQIDEHRPRRTLKNLFQEAGVPPWTRERLPLVFCDDALVWVPGIGIASPYRVRARAIGLLPEWRESVRS